MDAHRPDELTALQHRPGNPAGQAAPRFRPRGETMNNDQLARQIDELEQNLRREDPSLAQQFNRLNRAHTRKNVAVFSLLGVSLVLLAIALATTSPFAGFGGIVAYVAAFGVYDRHLRKLGRPSTPHRRRAPWR